ncbi:MAG TPA: hypothetical protein VFQ07_07090 [Candidatus Polarisedimenticolia bacterium]|nr:hypothetical protein [Candidatus Polarisedimenticolia bacterium]
MSVRRLLLLSLAVWLASAGLASANWTATGTFRYVDREFDQNGFTGVEPSLPIRFATVEVRDPNAPAKKAVLATGATDASGNFSIPVTDSSTRTVYVRVLTTSTGNTYMKVQNRLIPKNPYAVASANAPTTHRTST